MTNRMDYQVAYSDGADHKGVASFSSERDARAFLNALNMTGDYVTHYQDRSRMVRSSVRAAKMHHVPGRALKLIDF